VFHVLVSFWVGSNPVATGGFGGLSPPTKLQDPKLKYETLLVSGIFVKFECHDPSRTNVMSPIDDFLATVLVGTSTTAWEKGVNKVSYEC